MSKEVTIKQVSASIPTSGNHPYYQWGRKDPFLPSNGLNRTTKTWYDKNGTSSTDDPAREDFTTDGIAFIKNCILKPSVMQRFTSGHTYANLWSANNNVYSNNSITGNDENIIKTIYDPSPVGFKLPASNAFTGFTKTGKKSEPNGTWNSSMKGWNFYTDSSKSKTIFFPASGCRSNSRSMTILVGRSGSCWSAIPYGHGSGHILDFYPSSVDPLHYHDRAYGFAVRSSQE